MLETKNLTLELKSMDEEGHFKGYLSVYDVADLHGDLVEHGAFTKTISEQKGIIPMFWNHDQHQPIGAFNLSDDSYGLKVSGDFFLKESPRATEMHGIAKRFHELGRPVGLSIGYKAIQKVMQDGIRHLKEIRLFEGSLTLLPALPQAQIADIKSLLGNEEKDFTAALQRIQVMEMRQQMMWALTGALDSILYGYDDDTKNMDRAARIQAAQSTIDQFSSAYMANLPMLLDMWGIKGLPGLEQKAGRRISSATRTYIEEAIQKLTALLAEEESTSAEEAAKSEAAAASKVIEPDALHSWLQSFREEWKAGFRLN